MFDVFYAHTVYLYGASATSLKFGQCACSLKEAFKLHIFICCHCTGFKWYVGSVVLKQHHKAWKPFQKNYYEGLHRQYKPDFIFVLLCLGEKITHTWSLGNTISWLCSILRNKQLRDNVTFALPGSIIS